MICTIHYFYILTSTLSVITMQCAVCGESVFSIALQAH